MWADVTPAPVPDGRKLLRLEVRNAETPIERKPEWIKTRAKMGPEYTAAAEPGEVRGPAHGVPGGRLPQHLRVLGGPRGDVPHRRRPVHPALRLLPDRHRQAAAARPRRAAPGRRERCRRWGCATPPSPASPATTCPTAAPGCTPRRCARSTSSTPDTGVENLIPDFNGKPDLLRRGLREPARGARPQRRDGAADLQADPPGVPLRPLARRASPRPATSAWSPSPT